MSKLVKALLVTVALLVMAVGGTLYAGYSRLQGYGGQALSDDKKAPGIRVKIPKGSTAQAMGSQLEHAGVIKSGRQFYWYVRLVQKKDHALKPGEYDLSPAMTPEEVVQKITKGDVVTYKFTVPEGSNYKDIARIIGASGLATEEEALALCTDAEFATSLGIPEAQHHVEGYLAADTYKFPSGVTAKDILKAMRARTAQLMSEDIVAKGKAVKLDPHQILTLASIVEKETGAQKERPIISSVFHNRLKQGIKLQTDPTVIYGITNYSGNITKRDLETPTPYNTYTIKGLPPGPIASPGAAAIQAAVEPATTRYIFFVSQNDGTHVFCETLKCHEENVKKWQVEFFRKKSRKE